MKNFKVFRENTPQLTKMCKIAYLEYTNVDDNLQYCFPSVG